LILDVRDRDRDAALLLLLRVVDLVERVEGVNLGHLVVQHPGDRRGQRGLAVVDVPDRADVDVRLSPLELGLRHCFSSLISCCPCRLSRRATAYCLLAYSPRALAMISLAMLGGTSAYESNCIL